jgi:CheY-like chemotaxis protein
MTLVEPKSRSAILVVDDDDDGRANLRDLLAKEYAVLEARNGAEALAILRSNAGGEVRLVLLDLFMPCLSGWELRAVLREDATLSRIPVVVMSALPSRGNRGAGAGTWLRKPFTLSELRSAVSAVVPHATGAAEGTSLAHVPGNGARPSPNAHRGLGAVRQGGAERRGRGGPR